MQELEKPGRRPPNVFRFVFVSQSESCGNWHWSQTRFYCDNKEVIAIEPFYDNSDDNALLFKVHAGMICTLEYRSCFDCAPEVQAAMCRGCGGKRGTTKYAKLSPSPKEGITMPQALGFLDADGSHCFGSVSNTKVPLELRHKAIKQSRIVPVLCVS